MFAMSYINIVLNTIPTLYEGYVVSVHRMDMENRPVDPGSMEGTNFGSSGICFFFFFWDGVFGDSRSDYLCFLGGVLVF